jgi:hypothetical protein
MDKQVVIRKEDRSKLLKQVVTVYRVFVGANMLDEHSINLNKVLIAKAIDSAINDMGRMADFHFNDSGSPDNHKIAGFVAKWVAKERPIQLPDSGTHELSDWMYKINASFAVFVFQSFVKRPVPSEIAKNLSYWFRFRDERGETLALIAYCCEQMAKAD